MSRTSRASRWTACRRTSYAVPCCGSPAPADFSGRGRGPRVSRCTSSRSTTAAPPPDAEGTPRGRAGVGESLPPTWPPSARACSTGSARPTPPPCRPPGTASARRRSPRRSAAGPPPRRAEIGSIRSRRPGRERVPCPGSPGTRTRPQPRRCRPAWRGTPRDGRLFRRHLAVQFTEVTPTSSSSGDVADVPLGGTGQTVAGLRELSSRRGCGSARERLFDGFRRRASIGTARLARDGTRHPSDGVHGRCPRFGRFNESPNDTGPSPSSARDRDAHARHRGRRRGLSRIAEDLDASLGGLQWVVDAYTLALAATVLTFGSWPTASAAAWLFTAALAFGVRVRSPRPDRSSSSSAPAPCRASAPRSCSPSPSRSSPTLSPARRSAGCTGRLWRDDRRVVRHRPARRRRAHQRLDWQSIFLVNIPLGIACVWITRRTCASRATRPQSRRRPGPGRPRRGPVPARARAAARQRGGLESTPIVAARRCRGPARRVRRHRASREGADAPARAVPQPELRRRAGRGLAISATFFAVFLYLTLYLQQVLGLSAIEAGLVYLPATIVIFLCPARRRPRREGLPRGRWSVAGSASSRSAWAS